MIVSAVTINDLDKEEQKEHFFNDVKYATISLNKDIQQILEKYEKGILEIPIAPLKARLLGEYNEFGKPTYGFLRLENISWDAKSVYQLAAVLKGINVNWLQCLEQVSLISERLPEFGLEKHWNYHRLLEFITLVEAISPDVTPTRYWLIKNKYDFIQELMNESQNKIKEYQTAMQEILQSWSELVLEVESVDFLDYYIERKKSGLKLFDVNFHKAKKRLKELYQAETRTLSDSEIEKLHDNSYICKRNEYWITRNHSRIKQFLGDAYQGVETDFIFLRSQYAIFYKIGTKYGCQDNIQTLIKTFVEPELYQSLVTCVSDLKQQLSQLEFEQLLTCFPCEPQEVIAEEFSYIYQVLKDYNQILHDLMQDYNVLLSFSHDKDASSLHMEDLRKTYYCLEKIEKKQEWMKQNQYKIKELLRNEKPTTETDWNELKNKLFHTELITYFKKYEIAKRDSVIDLEDKNLSTVVRYILQKECPMKEELLYKRVVDFLNLTRMTPKVKEAIIRLLANELSEEFYKEEEFLYVNSMEPLSLRIPANADEKREITMIAKKELKAGICSVIEYSYELTMDGIGKEIAGILGYPRRSKKFNDMIEQAVLELQREKKIRRFSGGFQILAD